MESTIRDNEGSLTIKHLLLVGLALAASRRGSYGPVAMAVPDQGEAVPPAQAPPGTGRGRRAESPVEIPSRRWKDVVVRTWKGIVRANAPAGEVGF